MKIMTRFEMCDAILAAYRLQGTICAYGMWLRAQEEGLIEEVDLIIHARGNVLDEQAVQKIRDFDGVRRACAEHGLDINDPQDLGELIRRIKLKANLQNISQVRPSKDEEDDRATAMLHAFSGLYVGSELGRGRKGR